MTTILALMKTWILVLTVHGHGPYHGHNVVQNYYPSQSQCESAATALESSLNARGIQATAVCIEGSG